MFDVEPRDANKIPVLMKHDFETPTIETEADPAQFDIMMQLVNVGAITMESAMDKLGLRDLLKEDSSTGGDVTPTVKVWNVTDSFNPQQKEMHKSKIELLNLAKQALKIQNGVKGKEDRERKRSTAV